MKLFQLVQQNFITLGINPNQSIPQNTHPFSHRALFGLFLFGATIISPFLYALWEAKDLFEFTQSICTVLVTITSIISFLTFVFEMSKLVGFYDFAEKNIDGKKIHWNLDSFDRRHSAWHWVKLRNWILFLDFQDPAMMTMYVNINQQIEKFSEIICLVMGKAAPIFFVVPQFVVSFVKYFTTDLGPDAFELSMLMW